MHVVLTRCLPFFWRLPLQPHVQQGDTDLVKRNHSEMNLACHAVNVRQVCQSNSPSVSPSIELVTCTTASCITSSQKHLLIWFLQLLFPLRYVLVVRPFHCWSELHGNDCTEHEVINIPVCCLYDALHTVIAKQQTSRQLSAWVLQCLMGIHPS